VSGLGTGGAAWQCIRSGASSDGSLLQYKVVAETLLSVAMGSWDSQVQPKLTWSCRFLPTPGKCCTSGMLNCLSCSASPMPDCISNRGVWIAPNETTTSRLAATRLVFPSVAISTPVTRFPSKIRRVTRVFESTARLGQSRMEPHRHGRLNGAGRP